jgi:CheY-like chemotaxis protein
VLFVDDEVEIIQMASHMLSTLGYQPVVVPSGTEALRLFRENPSRFDVALIDQTMPGMIGTELARELLAVRPDLPIILVSGFSETILPQHIEALGIREFMMKPIIMRHLAETLRKVLDQPGDEQRNAKNEETGAAVASRSFTGEKSGHDPQMEHRQGITESESKPKGETS